MPKQAPQKILVVEYDPTWPLTFAALKAPLAQALEGIVSEVEHVGSTSVPGLAAKPIIDIDIVVPTRNQLPAVIERLAALQYLHRGNQGIEDREAFESPSHLPTHHLYACVQGTPALANHLAIRDYLRKNPPAAAAYGRLKRQLAESFPTDRESYVAGKTDFLLDILQRAGFPDAALNGIRLANQKK